MVLVTSAILASFIQGGQPSKTAQERITQTLSALSLKFEKLPQAKPTERGIRIDSKEVSIQFELPSGRLLLYSLDPTAGERNATGSPSLTEEGAINIAKTLHSKLGLAPYQHIRASYRVKKPMSYLSGCYFVLFTRVVQGVDVNSNGTHTEVVVDAYSKKVRMVRSAISDERYFGGPAKPQLKISASLLKFARGKGVTEIKIVGSDLYWVGAASIPKAADKYPGIRLKKDLILCRTYAVGNLVIMTDPATGAILGSQRTEPLRLAPDVKPIPKRISP